MEHHRLNVSSPFFWQTDTCRKDTVIYFHVIDSAVFLTKKPDIEKSDSMLTRLILCGNHPAVFCFYIPEMVFNNEHDEISISLKKLYSYHGITFAPDAFLPLTFSSNRIVDEIAEHGDKVDFLKAFKFDFRFNLEINVH